MNKIKILYLIDKMKDAGAQRHLVSLVSGMDRDKFEAKILTLELLGVKRIYGISGIRGLFSLIRLMRQEKFDVVHSYLFSENILGVLAAAIAGVPVVITSRRDTGMLCQGKWHNTLAYRLTNPFVDKIVCVSEAVKQVTLKKERADPKKVTVIYNGVEPGNIQFLADKQRIKSTLGIEKDAPVVGMVANFSWIKGHKEVMQAAGIVLQEAPDAVFLFIGDGPLLPKYIREARERGLEEKMIFLGNRRDISELISVMDVSVNASYSEGMSNAVLESMAMGAPVVASAVDGNYETVADNLSGLLFSPRNPRSLAEAIIKLLKNRELAADMASYAKELVRDKFSRRQMIENTQELYETLLKPKAAFISSQFPMYDEMFILREMSQLKESGLDFVIYSIKPCKDEVIHYEAKGLLSNTYYLPFFSGKLFLVNLYYLLRHPRRYISACCSVFFGNLKSANFLFKSIFLIPQAVGFAGMARKHNVTQVHGQWATYPATMAFVISKLNNIPFSFTGHAHDIYLDTTMLAEKISRAKFVTTCTHDNRRYMLELLNGRGTPADNIIVNYHGVDLNVFSSKHRARRRLKARFNILSVGSLLKSKGFDILIEACRILEYRCLDFECVIAGGGELEKKLKDLVKAYSLEERITFTGYIAQEDLVPFYLQADAFALPVRLSIHWGIPNVLVEAMAVNIPVICTDLPSIGELIKHGENGFIIPEQDPNALADVLERLSRSKKLRESIGSAAREVIEEKFDACKNAKKLGELFGGVK